MASGQCSDETVKPTRFRKDLLLLILTCVVVPIINIRVYQSARDSDIFHASFDVLGLMAFFVLPLYLYFVFALSSLFHVRPYTIVLVVLWVIFMALANLYTAIRIGTVE
jgi:hypothetical protein